MGKKVVIIGGGVAGLSAAHELVERGFDVEVYERRNRLGGKSASVNRLPGAERTDDEDPGKKGLPAEHGFRFFPGWYRHLPETLKHIPYKDGTVYDNLVSADRNLFTSYYRDPIQALLRFPRSFTEFKTVAAFPLEITRLGLTPSDLAFFFGKLLEYASASEERRASYYDTISWWDFMEAEAPTHSDQFRAYLVDAVTRSTVAAKPKQASADTIARVALRSLLDTFQPDTMIDRVLNGPSSEVWIEPWVSFLKRKGVKFFCNVELDSLEFEAKSLKSVRFVRSDYAQRNMRSKAAKADRALRASQAAAGPSWAKASSAEDIAAQKAQQAAAVKSHLDSWRERAKSIEHSRSLNSHAPVTADYFVFAIPVEQMAYYVHRSPTLQRLDPKLRNLIPLSDHVDWMAGIQYYLTEDVKITPGHLACIDSEWRLTAISQNQFWPNVDMKERGDGHVKTVLSVDISAWDVKGQLFRREAFACSAEEIAEEVWQQLKRSLNRPNRNEILLDSMLLGAQPIEAGKHSFPKASFSLDDDLVDRFDRKKEAFYKKFESVHFSAEAIRARQREQNDDTTLEASFAFGERTKVLAEPLLINRVGGMRLRPSSATQVDNLFLAGDYLRTHTNLASMEAANESARAAVNEILERSGSDEPACRIYPFRVPAEGLRLIEGFFRASDSSLAAVPVRMAAQAATVAADFAKNSIGKFFSRSK